MYNNNIIIPEENVSLLFKILDMPLVCVRFYPQFYTDEWTLQATTGLSPPALYGHTFTMIDHHRAVVFGGLGYGQLGYVNKTYLLDMDTWVWYLLINTCSYNIATNSKVVIKKDLHALT